MGKNVTERRTVSNNITLVNNYIIQECTDLGRNKMTAKSQVAIIDMFFHS